MKSFRNGIVLLISTAAASAGSYEVTIEHGDYFPIAWSFQAKTVSQAFPTAWAGTTLQFWNASSQSWTSVTWNDLDEVWFSPNRVIENGEAFLWQNNSGTARTITVSGTDITAASVTRNLTGGKWYLIADCYLRSAPRWMECVTDSGVAQYTSYSLAYPGSTGDIAHLWNNLGGTFVGGVRTDSTACDFIPFWGALNPTTACEQPAGAPWGSWVSPQINPGAGFWFLPISNVTWIVPHPSNETDCNP